MYKLAHYINVSKHITINEDVNYLVTISRKGTKEFLINEAIYEFMLQFINYNTLDAVIDNYLELLNINKALKAKVEKQFTPFYKQLLKRKWIVAKDEVIPEISNTPYFKVGESILNYKILKIIASNSTTDVYLVKKEQAQKKLVIKLINPKKFSTQSRYKKYEVYFKEEYNFIKTFHSIYINKGVNYLKHQDYSFMVLEYINGQSLFRYVRHNKLSIEDKKMIVHKFLKGFSIIHKNSVYHGDIHLSNVLITPKAQVKIIDFGYSNKAISTNNQEHIKQRNGGVHAFIPPERAKRSITSKFKSVTNFQSEVYQIGLLIYYVFVKELPFKAETWKTMVDEKKTFNIKTHHDFIKKRIPKKVRNIIEVSLQKEPELRYKNAQEMLIEWKKL